MIILNPLENFKVYMSYPTPYLIMKMKEVGIPSKGMIKSKWQRLYLIKNKAISKMIKQVKDL